MCFRNLFLQNPTTDCNETLYVAFGMPAHYNLFDFGPYIDLEILYANVKFGHLGICMEKSENYIFFENYCSLLISTLVAKLN